MNAVVVGHTDIGEADRIVRLLTAEQGRVSAVARGARRSKKRYAGALDPGTRLSVELTQGRSRIPSLGNPSIRQAPNRARNDYSRIAYMLYGCELCASLAPENDAAPRLFGLLESWLNLLEADDGPSVASRIALEAKALTFAGLCPALIQCAACLEPLMDTVHFDADSGGGLHPWCGIGQRVHVSVLHRVEQLRRTPLADTSGHPWTGPVWLLSDFARYHLGHAIKTRSLLMDATLGGDTP